MSKFDQIRYTVTDFFRSAWPAVAPAALPLASVEMPNVKFERPTAGNAWGRLSIQQGGRNSVALGGLRVRGSGVVFLQVFLPEDSGTKVATDAGDSLAEIFDNATVALKDASGFLRFQYVSNAGNSPRDGYEQHTFSVAYQADENL